MGKTVGHEVFIRRLYNKGRSVGYIARKLRVATTAVSQRLERIGLRERVSQRIVPKEKRKQIATLYRKKVRTGKIAAMFKIGKGTVRVIAREYGCQINPRGQQYHAFSKRQIARMLELWKKGHAQWDIGQRFGIQQTQVSRLLRDRGQDVKPRLARGERHGAWNGGVVITPCGYRRICVPRDHKFAEMRDRVGYILEHRLKMAEHLGRALLPQEIVHHVNGDRTDNRIENLELRHKGNHPPGVRFKCCDCGSTNVKPY
jgi:predicted transcriptional regulator